MIANLREYRDDGQVIHDGDSIEKIKSLGPISRVTRVKWTHEGRELERSNRFGIFVKLRPQRDALLCIESHDEKAKSNSLRVLNADGSVRFEVPPVMEIEGAPRRVTFMYTYPEASRYGGAFAVVVDAPDLDAQYRVSIDYLSGEILEIVWIKC